MADLIIEKSPISSRSTYAPTLSSQDPSFALTPFKITPSSTSCTVASSAACHGILNSVPLGFNLKVLNKFVTYDVRGFENIQGYDGKDTLLGSACKARVK